MNTLASKIRDYQQSRTSWIERCLGHSCRQAVVQAASGGSEVKWLMTAGSWPLIENKPSCAACSNRRPSLSTPPGEAENEESIDNPANVGLSNQWQLP